MEIEWLVNPEWAPLLQGNPALARTRIFPRGDFRGLKGAARFVTWLRREPAGWKAQAVLDLQGLLRSALITRATGARETWGRSDAREGARLFYRHTVPVRMIPHAVDRYLALARAFAGDAWPADSRAEFWLPPADPPAGLPGGPFVALHPYSRGEGKSLTSELITEFCRRLRPRPVVLLGRTAGAKHRWPENVIDLVNATTLEQLIAALREAAFVASVDSGPMHLAAALSSNLISVHAWSDPRRVGPYSPSALVWKGGRIVSVSELSEQDEEWFKRAELPSTAEIRRVADRVAERLG